MTFTRKLGLMLLITYATFLTADKIYQAGETDGIKQGYPAGVKQGIARGWAEACMIKPI